MFISTSLESDIARRAVCGGERTVPGWRACPDGPAPPAPGSRINAVPQEGGSEFRNSSSHEKARLLGPVEGGELEVRQPERARIPSGAGRARASEPQVSGPTERFEELL